MSAEKKKQKRTRDRKTLEKDKKYTFDRSLRKILLEMIEGRCVFRRVVVTMHHLSLDTSKNDSLVNSNGVLAIYDGLDSFGVD